MLKAANIGISFWNFITDYLKMKFIKFVPPEMIFKAWVTAKKLEIDITIDLLITFYKTINNVLTDELDDFNKNAIETEFRLKRFGSHYILSGSFDELSQTIVSFQKENKQLVIKGKFKTKSEKDAAEIANNLVRLASERAKDLPEKPAPKEEPAQKKYFWQKLFEKDKPSTDKSLKQFKAELKSDLKDGKIFMSKGESLDELKKYIFKDTYETMFNSLQSGLNIQFRDIEAFLDKNIDIKNILELLNKLHYFDKKINLQTLEKFILLKDENEQVLKSLIDARKADFHIDLKELWEYHLRGGNMSHGLKILIKAQKEGLNLNIKQLTEQVSLRRNDAELVEGLIKLRQENIEMELNELGGFQDKFEQIDQFVRNLIKASQLGLYFSNKGIKTFHANGGDVAKLMDVMIKAKQSDLDVTFDDCLKLNHAGYDFSLLLEALKVIRRSGLDISKESLINLQVAGGNMFEFAEAFDLGKKLKLDIKSEDLETDAVEGRRIKEIMLAIMHSRSEGIGIDYHTCIKYDRAGQSVPDIVKWAINPKIIHIEPIKIISKDAVELKLLLNITVRGKFYSYFSGSRDEVLTSRVNEALIKEVERYTSYRLVLESLNFIANRLYLRLNAKMTSEDFPEMILADIEAINKVEEKRNAASAYEILDVNIPGIEVGSDALIENKKEKADLDKILEKSHYERRKLTAIALELEAKAKLADAEAEVQLGIAEAFKNGQMNMKDYHKSKIFEDKGPLSYEKKSIGHDHE
jgi:uncharacterized protein YqfA (UPF0365 family)